MSDPLADLAAIVAAAAASGTVDPHALRDTCLRVIHGGQCVKERLGHLLASKTLEALESATARPARDPLAAAQAAFVVPKDGQG